MQNKEQSELIEEMLSIVENALNTDELKRPIDIVNELTGLVEAKYDI